MANSIIIMADTNDTKTAPTVDNLAWFVLSSRSGHEKKVADNIRFFVKNVLYCDYDKPQQMLELLSNDAKYRN